MTDTTDVKEWDFTTWVLLGLPVAVVFMHFTFGYVSGFPITVGFLYLGLMVAMGLAGFLAFDFMAMAMLAGLLVFLLAINIEALGHLQFWRSYGQMAFGALGAALSFRELPRSPAFRAAFLRVALGCILALAGLVLLQSVLLNVFGSRALSNVFGPFMHFSGQLEWYQDDVLWHDSGLRRPMGTYFEPSVAGWMLNLGYALALSAFAVTRRRGHLICALVAALAAAATLSLTGVLGLMVTTVLFLLLERSFPVLVAALAGMAAILAALASNGVFDRIAELKAPDTSGYIRVTGPLNLIASAFTEGVAGHPLYAPGAEAEIQRVVTHTRIDNSFVLIIYHAGIVGLLLIAALAVRLVNLILAWRVESMLFAAMLVAMAGTGALWAPWFVLVAVFTALCMRCLGNERHDAGRASALHHHHHP
jgi:hypothetical protein